MLQQIALWKIETLVDVKRQKQPPGRGGGGVEGSSFCSFKIFHWYFITDLIVSKYFSLTLLFELPLIKVEAHFYDEQDQKLLPLYETMYTQTTLRLKG